MSLESQIDELFKGSPDRFTADRNTLAKTLSGAERQRVAALRKPTAPVWAINQTYWRARPAYEKVLETGAKLRAAQLAALKGRSADIRGATETHRDAVAKAVAAASRLGEAAGLNPSTNTLQLMFQAIGTRESLPEPHGRFQEPIQLSGFEALAGVPITSTPDTPSSRSHGKKGQDEKAERERQKQEAAERRRREAALEKAQERVAQAAEEEHRTRAAWDRAKDALADAQQRLREIEDA